MAELADHVERGKRAGVAELADAYGSEPYGLKSMGVRVLSPAHKRDKRNKQVEV